MKSTRIVAALTLASVCASAFAYPMYWEAFKTNYKVQKNSALDKANCAVCHVGKSTKLNPFGLDVKKALSDAKSHKVTPEILAKLESLDSDKDGVKNIDEIKAGTNPGDAKSK